MEEITELKPLKIIGFETPLETLLKFLQEIRPDLTDRFFSEILCGNAHLQLVAQDFIEQNKNWQWDLSQNLHYDGGYTACIWIRNRSDFLSDPLQNLSFLDHHSDTPGKALLGAFIRASWYAQGGQSNA